MTRNIRKGPITAQDLVEKLAKDPEYQRRMAGTRAHQLQQAALEREMALPLMRALQSVGCEVRNLNQLRESVVRYGKVAVPILMEWLPKIEHPRLKEIIARGLSADAAKPDAARLLIQEFQRADDKTEHSLKWALGNALEVVADDSVLDDIIEIATNPALGTSRSMVIMALGNMKDKRALQTALRLLNEPDAAGPAIKAIRKLKAEIYAIPQLEELAKSDKRGWVRQEAKKAVKAAATKRGLPRRTQ